MNTNAEDRDINQVNRTIGEWLGKCWHEAGPVDGITVRCKHCTMELKVISNPDYTSSLDAVAEAEARAVRKFGLRLYGTALRRLRSEVGTGDEEYALAALSPTLTRATAIFNLITESRALEVK